MSKKQRKKLNPNRQITMTVKERDQLEKRVSKEATEKAVNVTLLFPLLILRDKYGFGPKRLREFMEYYNDLLDSFNKGYVSLPDIAQQLEKETGIRLGEGADQ